MYVIIPLGNTYAYGMTQKTSSQQAFRSQMAALRCAAILSSDTINAVWRSQQKSAVIKKKVIELIARCDKLQASLTNIK